MRRRVTAIILAGGASKRFGADKAFAMWKGKAFIENVAEAAQGVADGFLILAPHKAGPHPYVTLVPGASVWPDREAGIGPVEALRDAIRIVQSPTVLVVPCDAPGLSAALARRLVALSEEQRKPTVAQAREGPVYTLFAIATALLRERLDQAESLQDLTRGAEFVETDLEGLNVNEPPT